MADKNLNLKPLKPTLKPPSEMGKKIDTGFNTKMRNAGVNFKSIKEEEGKNDTGKSLKKKIFSLPKMETLVAQDDYLHGIYEKMKVDASETYGYHWNETVHNIIFNDFILNDNAYLQKYKNTKTIFKKRRGEEGAQELEKAVQDKINTNKSDGNTQFKRKKISDVTPKDSIKDKAKDQLDMEKEPTNEVADQMKSMTENLEMEEQQMNELFGFNKPAAPLNTHKASKNDTYYVDKKSNTAVGVISANLSQEQNQQTATQFVDASRYEKMPWYVAVQHQVKGVPPEVTDGSIQDFQQDTQKYAGVPAMQEADVEECNCPETKPVRNPNDAMASFSKLGEDDDSMETQQNENDPLVIKAANELAKISANINDMLAKLKSILIKYNIQGSDETQSIISKAAMMVKDKNIAENMDNVGETSSAASAGQFAGALDGAKHGGEITDHTYNIDETTTSASSGQYSGPAIWAKSEKNSRWAHKPAWHGGEILKEGKDYLTNPEAFKKYVQLFEAYGKIEKILNENLEEGASIKQDALNILRNLEQMKSEYPDLANDPHFQEIIATQTQRANAPEPVAPMNRPLKPRIDTTSQWKPQPEPMKEEPSFKGMLKTDLKDTGNKVSNKAGDSQLEKQDGLFKDKWNINESLNEDPVNIAAVAAGIAGVIGSGVGVAGLMQLLKTKYPNAYNALTNIGSGAKGGIDNFHGIEEKAVSKSQQQFMGMVHAAQKGELENPSAAVSKAAHSMSDKDAEDFASTKHKGLPDHVKENNMEMGMEQSNPLAEIGKRLYPDSGLSPDQLIAKAKEWMGRYNLLSKNPQTILDAMIKKAKEMGLGEGRFQTSPPNDEEDNSFESLVDNYRNGNISDAKILLQQIKAAGQIRDLRLYLDEMGQSEIKDWAFDNMNEESMLDDKEDSMARTMDSDELNTTGKPMGGGAPVAEADVETADVASPEQNQGDRQDKEAIADAAKFRQFLMSKYGVESVAELSPKQKQDVWKEMQAGKQSEPAAEKTGMDFKNFAATDAQRADYQGRDSKQLGFLAQHNNEINSIQDYQALEKKYGQEMGERMFHPMAILAAIDALPDEEKMQYGNILNVLKSQMGGGQVRESKEKWEQGAVKHPGALHKKLGIPADQHIPAEKINAEIAKLNSKYKDGEKMSDEDNHFKKMLTLAKTFKKQENMNEERKTPSMLNLDKVKKETAALTQKDMANADALKQAKVYPNPDEFYIEQDNDKVQDFQTGEEIEAEAMRKMEEKKALMNVGNSANENGNEIIKRNLTKEEKLKLAMDRGDGMHNIVYDNKPSEKFEKRLEKDMGADQYKLRQEKMKYKEKMPNYNKDTQPTESGEEKTQDDKFKKGFNEAFTGKYTDGYGKSKLVEFMLENTEEVASIGEGFKLTLEGLGNKYTQKVNESEIFADVVNQYDFYLVEEKVVRIKSTTGSEVITESTLDKMKHLMGYNSRDYVNTKKSVKF